MALAAGKGWTGRPYKAMLGFVYRAPMLLDVCDHRLVTWLVLSGHKAQKRPTRDTQT